MLQFLGSLLALQGTMPLDAKPITFPETLNSTHQSYSIHLDNGARWGDKLP